MGNCLTRVPNPAKPEWACATAWVSVFIAVSFAAPLLAAQDAQEESQTTPEATYESAPPAYEPLPSTLTIAAGTLLSIRTSQLLSSDQSRPGDLFSAELQQPLVVDGWVLARRGQTVVGRVVTAKRAGRIKGVSELAVELTQLVLVDGQQIPLRTQFMNASGETSQGRDAQGVGTATGTGAVIGAISSGGKGAAIGAAAGAGAGLAGVLLTRGRATEIPPETVLTFQVQSQITISTERSRVAFRPVGQSDYEGGRSLQRRSDNFAPRPRRRPSLYPYSPWGYYRGPAFFGYYHGGGHRRHRRW